MIWFKKYLPTYLNFTNQPNLYLKLTVPTYEHNIYLGRYMISKMFEFKLDFISIPADYLSKGYLILVTNALSVSVRIEILLGVDTYLVRR